MEIILMVLPWVMVLILQTELYNRGNEINRLKAKLDKDEDTLPSLIIGEDID